MPSPFPGMNPYLEHPELWPGIHHWLIIAIAEALVPPLRPKYRVAVEVRLYEEVTGGQSLSVGIPDVTIKRSPGATSLGISDVAVAAPKTSPLTVAVPMPLTVRQGYLEVREVATGEVVTAIELLSPTNKRGGKGRRDYESKRMQVLGSLTHLVEIDLLRERKPMPVLNVTVDSDYRILVSRSERRPQADLYAFNLRDSIPSFPLPLQAGDREPFVDLQFLLQQVYDRAGYDLAIDYAREPVPALSEEDAAWMDALLREKGLR